MITVLKIVTHPQEIESCVQNPSADDLNKLWELDHIGILSNEQATKNIITEQQFTEKIDYDEVTNQYTVGLPWKNNKEDLPHNFGLALGRLRSLQRKFENDTEYCKQYSKVIKDQLSRGFIEEINRGGDLLQGGIHYLPHHGVTKQSNTTPIRIVYDCSAKTPKTLSLNDCLRTGPSLIPELAQLLLRFRCHKYAFVSDIEKAFLMVSLNEEDRDYTRFLWPSEPQNPQSKFTVYRFKVVLFGATCSQYLLNATIKHHLEKYDKEKHMIDRIKRDLYVDNLQGNSDDEVDLVNYYWQVQKVFKSAHLFLKEWVTNSPKLREQLQIDGVNAIPNKVVKVLGLYWNTDKDTMSFQFTKPETRTCTKRICLSILSQLFDPLGLLLPVTIKSRMFLQSLWVLKVGWDQSLPDVTKKEWIELINDIYKVCQTTIKRKMDSTDKAELHVFSDASNTAYGTCAYVIQPGKKGTLIIGKAKVAPIKKVTIPKLELTAVLLAARMIAFIKDAFMEVIKFKEIYLWCDSQVALHWLHSDKDLPTYVSNRVEEIKALISTNNIRYVTTKDNPADLLTRGITNDALNKSSVWWNGPQWLPHKNKWPEKIKFASNQPGQNSTVEKVLVTTNLPQPEVFMEWGKYSSYDKCLRVLAWVLRFQTNIRARVDGLDVMTDPHLSVREIRAAETKLLRVTQRESFPQEIKILDSKKVKNSYTNLILQLGLYSEHGVIKCAGRFQLATMKDETKHPTLLSGKHHVTQLLIQRSHELNHHFGVNYVMSFMRQRWWIPRMRQVMKSVLRNCLVCKRHHGKRYSQQNAPPLPSFRIEQSVPFRVTGVDYTGAIKIKAEGGVTKKCYICLFTCATTRAVHLELVEDLSGQSFIYALRRFVGRQGFPQIILSDNATTFNHASRYLKTDPKVKEQLEINRCEWHFIPARAPWFGAIWERLIGVMKSGLRKVIGRALVTFEELHTLTTELESSVNDRPLSYVEGDPNEPNAITPSQLIRGRRLRTFPNDITVEEISDPSYATSSTLNKRIKYIEHLSRDLWKRWMNDYVLALRDSHRCMHGNDDNVWPRVGDVVLIHSDEPRSIWKLGKITGLHRGRDGLIRVADLKTAQGTTTRPVVKLYPLEQDLVPSVSNLDNTEDPATNSDAAVSGAVRNWRPARRAALESANLWRTNISKGLL
jgi:hypothetical protein